jgi:hypothetical protein
MNSYPAKYMDRHGCEMTTIINDGETLQLMVRGIVFRGTSFDSLSPSEQIPREQLQQFTLQQDCLCSCSIECEISIPLHDKGRTTNGTLLVKLDLGEPMSNGALNREELSLTFKYDSYQFISSAKSGWFEDELLEIQNQLSEGVYLLACINCLYSDYSPYGHGLFGYMMCFKNLKVEYLAVKTKIDFWSVHDRYDRFVQETYLCPEFQRRLQGTGYRG